ncbi:MAG TPA: uracil-DNA glycosylase [Chloroflexota bacterium]|nr:uracil-DNA glycosylase [Chloroflexota bacterium]
MSTALDELAVLQVEVRACVRCDLSGTRISAVPGEGPLDAEVLLVGEAPGRHEDVSGRPFVGASGRFLDELLASIGLTREQVFITSVVKCRPPSNRDPAPGELAACAPYLERQLGLLDPLVIVTLGRFAMARWFPGQSIMRIHGQPRREGAQYIFPMIHPAAALHRREHEALLREDILKIPALLEEIRRERVTPSPEPPEEPAPPADDTQQLSLF